MGRLPTMRARPGAVALVLLAAVVFLAAPVTAEDLVVQLGEVDELSESASLSPKFVLAAKAIISNEVAKGCSSELGEGKQGFPDWAALKSKISVRLRRMRSNAPNKHTAHVFAMKTMLTALVDSAVATSKACQTSPRNVVKCSCATPGAFKKRRFRRGRRGKSKGKVKSKGRKRRFRRGRRGSYAAKKGKQALGYAAKKGKKLFKKVKGRGKKLFTKGKQALGYAAKKRKKLFKKVKGGGKKLKKKKKKKKNKKKKKLKRGM